MTNGQHARLTADWERIAKEPVRIEAVAGAIMGFGSELACLRLEHAYRAAGRAAFSTNLDTWYFSIDHKDDGLNLVG